jgi:flagellar motor protein MotB
MRLPALRRSPLSLAATTVLLAALTGCANEQPPAPVSDALGPGSAYLKPGLGAERRRLAALLRGTPAIVRTHADGGVRVDVPLASSFDSGRSVVKAPLAGVLERLARRERSASSRILITAPTDPTARGLLLGTERAVNARSYMEERGVPAERFSVSAIGRGRYVEIIVAQNNER